MILTRQPEWQSPLAVWTVKIKEDDVNLISSLNMFLKFKQLAFMPSA